jgi:cell division protein FtsW
MGSRTELKKNPSGLDLAIDIPFLVIVAALLVVGLLMLYSASWDVSWRQFKDVNSFFLRQLIWLGIGSVAAVIFYFMDYHRWERNNFAILAIAVTVGLLLAVLIIGEGSARSLFGGKSVQPSELAKIVIVIYLAVWLYAKGDKIKQVGFGLIPLALILGLVGGLIAIQTDVSAAVTVFALGMMLFYMAGGSLVQIFILLIVSGTLGSALLRSENRRFISVFWTSGLEFKT